VSGFDSKGVSRCPLILRRHRVRIAHPPTCVVSMLRLRVVAAVLPLSTAVAQPQRPAADSARWDVTAARGTTRDIAFTTLLLTLWTAAAT
jgi:hypothetical protein